MGLKFFSFNAIYLGLPPPKQLTLLSLSHTFTLWKSQAVQKNWIFIPRPDIPFRVFKCWTLDYNWPSWDTFGIHTLGSLYSDETFHTFESIAVKFDIPRSYFFQYLQIRNMVNTISWPNNPPHPLPFQRFLTQSEGRKGDISLIYNLLSDYDPDSKQPYMLKWEQELCLSFSLSQWRDAARSTSLLSKCINHKEIMRKIHLRWYLTPNRLQHIRSDSSKFCWRRCGAIGTQLHMWWSCPSTQVFWRAVNALISEVTQVQFTLSPELAVLDISLLDFPIPICTVVQHILISARFVIAQYWNSPSRLPISEVIRRANFHFHCETKVLTSPRQATRLLSLWEPWSDSKHCT